MSNPPLDTSVMTQKGAVPRDDNDTAVQYAGIYVNTAISLTGNNTTVSVPIFHVTGTVLVTGLWGVVTTVLGANNTAAYWRLNDQTNQSDITLSTGTVLSAAPVGSTLVKKGLAAAALTLLSSSQERVSEPTTLETLYFSPFVAVKKTAAVTDIEFTYSTTDTPTSGSIQFYASYVPLSADGKLTLV